MPRPKRPYNGVEDVAPTVDPYLLRLSPGGLNVRQKLRWDASSHWTYPTINGLYDPLTYLHVLATVAAIDPDIELRTNNLVEYLGLARRDFVWDAITVGKVLADLCDAFEDVLGKKNGILERGKDYKGTFYRIHHTGETARLYHAVGEDLYRLSEKEIAARRVGDPTRRLVSPLLECEHLRPESWAREA